MKLILTLTIILLGGGADKDSYVDYMENNDTTTFGDFLSGIFGLIIIGIILVIIGKLSDKYTEK